MNKLYIKGMYFHAFHGCLAEEAKLGGKYKVDVCIEADHAKAAETDKLEFAADYEKIFLLVEEQMNRRSELIESVAKRIGDALGAEYGWAHSILVTLTKYDPPIKGRRISTAEMEWKWKP
jgi:7,8-dihydroneopterin aldolase/epimerase/oxygenase